MKKRWPSSRTAIYAAVLAGCLAVAMVTGWTSFASQVDDDAYDWMFRRNPPAPAPARSIILAIDDATLSAMGGVRNVRTILAQTLERIAPAKPKLVAIDLVLADRGDPSEDARLERALAQTPNVILCTVLENGTWENPQPAFGKHAVAVGHAFADQQSKDGVTRRISLEWAENRERHWALALEAFRLDRGATAILESPDDLQIGNTIIRARYSDHRPLRIRYALDAIPRIPVKTLLDHPQMLARLEGQAVFLGVYSSTAARDRVVTPLGDGVRIPGLEVNAQAFETLERGHLLVDASNLSLVAFCAIVALLAGLIFAYSSGLPAYAMGAALLGVAHAVPFLLFQRGIVFPYFAPFSSAWLTVAGAASYQHFVVRRELRRSEDERTRYRQAIQFVTHEMRTPLTAIQGSSEIMGRYNLNDDKRKQIAQMINSESKRLAGMIQTFLDMERLSDGQMDLKNDPIAARELIEACLDRVRPLAERKNIGLHIAGDLSGSFRGDRELMDYALYNLLTNAIKYSPPDTEIEVASRPDGAQLRLSVKDQGMGMDEKELKKIFQRFYRTRRAEASGEKGSGIGLSIVDQIVQHHGGRMEVTSAPSLGSCFTAVLPALAAAPRPSPVSSLKG